MNDTMKPPTTPRDQQRTAGIITMGLGTSTLVMTILTWLIAVERDTAQIVHTVGMALSGLAVILFGVRLRIVPEHVRYLRLLRIATTMLLSAAALILGAGFLYDLYR